VAWPSGYHSRRGLQERGHSEDRGAATRVEDTDPLAASDALVIAIAADHAVEAATVPLFALDDVQGIAAFIIASTGLKST